MDVLEELKNHHNFDQLAIEHGLEGYYFQSFPQKFETSYLRQWHLNQIYLKEYTLLKKQAAAENILCFGIKGIALLGDIYFELGERKLSDIDLYTDHLEALGLILKAQNFNLTEKSNYKVVYHKMIDQEEIVFELHSKLYRNQSFPIDYDDKGLSDLEHLYFLIYHVSYQHTFIRLNWLLDIKLFIMNKKIDLNQLMQKAIERGHKNSFNITFYFLTSYLDFKCPYDQNAILSLYDDQFLLRPQNNKLKYYIMKHLTKKNFYDGIKYDFYWLKDNILRKTLPKI